MISVSHYGLHFASGDIGFLLQKGSNDSLYPDLPCPFEVRKGSSTRTCPHAVDLSQAHAGGADIFEDPLAGWFADPKGVAVIEDEKGELTSVVDALNRLYSPTIPVMAPAWAIERRHWVEDGHSTNLSPFTILGVSDADMNHVRYAASGVCPRPFLLVTTKTIPLPRGCVRLNTDLAVTDLTHRPMHRLGAWAVSRRLAGATPSPS